MQSLLAEYLVSIKNYNHIVMGCDGGTIPQRKEVVKNKNKERRERKKETDEAERWKICALSGNHLSKPIVSSPYGYLLDKKEILEHLIEKREDRLSSYHRIEDYPDILSPIHTLRNIKELKLKENPNANAQASTSGDDTIFAGYVCPITGLETNGKYKFFFSWKCGCVVSERAIKEVPNNDACLVCQEPYKEYHLVLINPSNKKELERNQAAMLAREMEFRLGKKDGKSKSSSSNSTTGPLTSATTSSAISRSCQNEKNGSKRNASSDKSHKRSKN